MRRNRVLYVRAGNPVEADRLSGRTPRHRATAPPRSTALPVKTGSLYLMIGGASIQQKATTGYSSSIKVIKIGFHGAGFPLPAAGGGVVHHQNLVGLAAVRGEQREAFRLIPTHLLAGTEGEFQDFR